MWLLERLAPDHKTIADFRRHNGGALVANCAAFVQCAPSEGLAGGTVVAIDRSKVQAVVSRKAVGKAADLERERQRPGSEVADYLVQLEAADRQEGQDSLSTGACRRALKRLRERQDEVGAEVAPLANRKATSSALMEPLAMKSLHGAPDYNLQTAVDTDSHLIVHHEVCNDASDAGQLMPMAQGAAQTLEAQPEVVDDAGYANGKHLRALMKMGMNGYGARSHTPNNQGDGTLYDKAMLRYGDSASNTVWDHYTTNSAQCSHGITRAKGSTRGIESGGDGLQLQARRAHDQESNTHAGTAGLSTISISRNKLPRIRGAIY